MSTEQAPSDSGFDVLLLSNSKNFFKRLSGDYMSCFLVNEKNKQYCNLGFSIEEFQSIELKNDEVWINGIIHFPADKILEIKIKEGDD